MKFNLMKKHYLKRISLAALISLSFAACVKKDEELEQPLTAESLAGQYLLTDVTAETSLTAPVSVISKIEACELDNIYELKADSSATYIDAGTQCNPAKGYSFKYNMTNNTVYLIGLQNKYLSGGSVKKFDGKTLVLEAKVKSPETANIETTFVGTLVKQPK
jgi:hypothetical protein